MKWRAESNGLKQRSYEIKHSPPVGYYLYVFEGDACVRDELQDSLEMAIQSALDDYQVPMDAWKPVDHSN
jgi:hypothetical protein